MFATELCDVLPNSELRKRDNFDLKEIIDQAIALDYTDLIVINEDKKQPSKGIERV